LFSRASTSCVTSSFSSKISTAVRDIEISMRRSFMTSARARAISWRTWRIAAS
jgi:hypothetical protein